MLFAFVAKSLGINKRAWSFCSLLENKILNHLSAFTVFCRSLSNLAMRPLTKRKAKNINEGFLGPRFPCCGIEGLRVGILFLLLGLSTAGLSVNAQEVTAEGPGSGGNNNIEGTSLEGVKLKRREDIELGADVSLGLESNAYSWGSRDHETASTASGGIKIGVDSFTFTSRVAASKINKEYEEWKWAEDFQMGLSRKPWRLSRDFEFGTGVTVTLPITEYSRKYSLLEAGAGLRGSLIWSLNRTLKGLKLTTSVRGTNFQYATPVAFDGRSNEEWRLNTRLVADYQFAEAFSLSALFGRTWAWTVNGAPLDRFETEQSITWQIVEYTSLSLGHSRGGNVLRSDGNSNVALYDEGEGSTFFIELGFEI